MQMADKYAERFGEFGLLAAVIPHGESKSKRRACPCPEGQHGGDALSRSGERGVLRESGVDLYGLKMRALISRAHGDLMPGNLHVRNLEDDLIARLKRRAARHGRSAEAEHREILRQALANEEEPSFEKLAADLRKLTKRRKQTPSEVLLREARAER